MGGPPEDIQNSIVSESLERNLFKQELEREKFWSWVPYRQ